MSKPLTHAQNNVEKYGGKVSDYLEIHELIDSSKTALGDKRHRAATHNAWFIYSILPKIFGSVLTNSDGKEISVTQIGEDHVLEDYQNKFIPTLEDFLVEIPMRSWMDNGNGFPPSCQLLNKPKGLKHEKVDWKSIPPDIVKTYRPIYIPEDENNPPVFYNSPASD